MTNDWLTHLPNATAPAWWGAVLSTILGFVKGWELWRDRFRVEVDYVFTGSAHIGNKIRIRNISPRPIMLSHWEVFYVSGTWLFREKTSISEMDFDHDGTTIQPQSFHTLNFVDENYFSTNEDSKNHQRIFIRLHVAGGRTIFRKVR